MTSAGGRQLHKPISPPKLASLGVVRIAAIEVANPWMIPPRDIISIGPRADSFSTRVTRFSILCLRPGYWIKACSFGFSNDQTSNHCDITVPNLLDGSSAAPGKT